ncbi:unnamed protein product [Hymenolepis diminuta]|uniref:KASH domain-containing protein n=1 Tax=Hymenolepis diminuta TaxID=6216 RepID=A0A564YH90_HYMDI|nr:unnamed protein product [Hymenolepis diminuta]
MQFLTGLTQKDREAAFSYYKVALKEVRQRGHCISSIHRLLALLSKEKSGDEELMLTLQHLIISNTACEGLCYDIWLRLLEMIIFLESFRPQKTIDKSAISAFHHLRNWQKELSNGSKRVWKLANENEPLTKRQRAQLWYSCFNDRLLLEKLTNKDQSSGGESSRHVTFENGQNLLKSVGKSLVPEDPNFHSSDIAMSDGVLTNDRVDSYNIKPKIAPNVTEAGTNSTNKHFEDDPISSKLSGLLNSKQFGGTRKLSFRTESGVLNTSLKDDTGQNVRSPASISHSEARKLISEMSTGSDIIRTPSPELARLGNTMRNSDKNAHRLDSYLAAAEAAEMFVAQLHSNSNVEISTIVLRKSCSDDHLLKAAMARTRSLNDLDGPHTDKTISLSHSLDDTTTYPFDASEHLMSAWDNYQVPYYSSIEGMEPSEPKAKFPETLFWEDLFPDETEALDFEQHLHQPQGTTRQIDEWSFEGLSSTPLSSLEGNEMIDANNGRSESSEALLESGDRDPFSEDDPASLPHSSEKHDKCLQTEMEESVNGTLTPSAFLNNSQSVIAHDTNTTHTSGYESGPDAVNSLFQRSALCSINNSEEVNTKTAAPTYPASRNFGVQVVRSGHYDTTYAIREESPDCTLLFEGVESDFITQSERDMMKLRDFLLEILASSSGKNDPSLSTTSDKKQKQAKCSDAFTGPRSVYNLMRCFSCMRKSAEQNSKLLQSSGDVYSRRREDLSDRQNVFIRWIDNHTKELQELNDFRDKIQELSAKVNALNQVVDSLSNQNSPKRSQTLANESNVLSRDAENLRDLILNWKLQTRNESGPSLLNSPELSDLNELYSECRNKFIDRIMQDVRSLIDQTNSLKSAFSYLGALNERLQITPEAENKTFLNGAKAINYQSNLLLNSERTVKSHLRFITQIPLTFFALLIFITFLYVLDGTEQYFPLRCMRNEWPGCRAIQFYQIGVPPQ